MLKTKCIKAAKEANDGTRISVMSRHTLNDGITPDPEITPASFDDWLVEFAPPAILIGSYYKRGLNWQTFEGLYKDYLRTITPKVRKLAERAKEDNITILCVEENAEFCHRRLLAEECKRVLPKLEINIS